MNNEKTRLILRSSQLVISAGVDNTSVMFGLVVDIVTLGVSVSIGIDNVVFLNVIVVNVGLGRVVKLGLDVKFLRLDVTLKLAKVNCSILLTHLHLNFFRF